MSNAPARRVRSVRNSIRIRFVLFPTTVQRFSDNVVEYSPISAVPVDRNGTCAKYPWPYAFAGVRHDSVLVPRWVWWSLRWVLRFVVSLSSPMVGSFEVTRTGTDQVFEVPSIVSQFFANGFRTIHFFPKSSGSVLYVEYTFQIE